MPWKESSILEQRWKFVQEWRAGDECMAELCRRYGISRQCGYDLIHRFEQEGEAGLAWRSRAPHRQARAMASEVAARIVAFREKHPRWGPRKLRAHLARKDATTRWPAPSSIGELLKREGLVVERRKRWRTPPYTQPLNHAGEPNQVWCADFKGWFLCGDGSRCDPLTCSDAFSRYLLRCRAVAKTDGPHVRSVFEAMFRQYGMPEAIRTDNGPPFASKAPGGLSRLSIWWLRLGIRHERIEPGHPEQNGRHERMHRTLKQETAMPPAANLGRQQQAFIRFEREYNQERPHEALDNRTPADLYAPSPRPDPIRTPELEYPAGVCFRRISQQGSLRWHTERTFISEVLGRETVGLLEVDDEYFEVYYGPLMLGWFDGQLHRFERAMEPRAEQFPAAASATP